MDRTRIPRICRKLVSGLAAFRARRQCRPAKDFRAVWKETARFMNRYRWRYLASLAVVVALCVFSVNPVDRELLETIQGATQDPLLERVAMEIAEWGDFIIFNLVGTLLLWAVGYFVISRWLQRVAIAALVAAVLAGVACNLFRVTMGRPRPHVGVEDRFLGFAGSVKGAKYHSFPSGHTATAFGSGIPITVAGGPWAVPATLASASVGWSRLYRNRHFPTDVLIGAYIGTAFGVASSWRLRKVRLRLKRKKSRFGSIVPVRGEAEGALVPKGNQAFPPTIVSKPNTQERSDGMQLFNDY